MFSLFKYTFSLSIVSWSDEVLMMRPTMYFLIPVKQQNLLLILIFHKFLFHIPRKLTLFIDFMDTRMTCNETMAIKL